MDLVTLLEMKVEAIRQSMGDAFLGDADKLLLEEVSKGVTADFVEIERLAKNVVAALFSSRLAQVDAHFAEGLAGRRALCVIDFATVPYSFNVLVNLFVADKFRQDQGCSILDVAFIAHAGDPGISGQPHHSEESLKRRFRTLANNLGIGAARLLPSVGSVLFFDNRTLFSRFLESTRADYRVFPEYYSARYPLSRISHDEADSFCFIHLTKSAQPAEVLSLAPPQDEVDLARRWLCSKVYPAVPVTLTLRKMSFESGRNSDLAAWSRILSRIIDHRIMFVVVPDYYDAFSDEAIQADNIVYCPEATLTVPFRAAIYSASSFNIFGNNGPLSIGYLSQSINYLIFLGTTDLGSSAASEIETGEGLVFGGQFWGAAEFQRLVWETRDEDAIVAAISKMIDDLDRAGRLVPAWYSGAV